MNQTRILNLSLNIKRILWCNQLGWNECESNSKRFRNTATADNIWDVWRKPMPTHSIICHYITSLIPRARKFLLAGCCCCCCCCSVSMFDVSINVYASIHPPDKLGSSLFHMLHNFNYYRQWNSQTTLSVSSHCIRSNKRWMKCVRTMEPSEKFKKGKTVFWSAFRPYTKALIT